VARPNEIRFGHRSGDEVGDGEVGAVREAGDEPGDHEHPVGVGEHAQPVAEGEGHHEDDDQPSAGDASGECGDQRGADDHAHGVGGDDVAGLGFGDAEVVGDVAQQAHRDELGGADAEATEGQGEHGDRPAAASHLGLPRQRRAVRVRDAGRTE